MKPTKDIIEALRVLQAMHGKLRDFTIGQTRTVHVAAVEVLGDAIVRLENASNVNPSKAVEKFYNENIEATRPPGMSFRTHGVMILRDAIADGSIDEMVQNSTRRF